MKMKMIEIIVDFSFMTQFEKCKDFISLVEKTIKAKHNFKNIQFFDFLGEQIILSGQYNAETVFKMAMMAYDIMSTVYEYNQPRKEQGRSLFIVDMYAVINDNGFVSKKKNLCVSNIVQWGK